MVLARYVTGSASTMGTRNDIDLDNKYIVLDTSGMPDDLLLPGIFWATDIANDLIMDSRENLSALIADELWSLVGANSNPLAAGFVQEMVKTIRGLGGIAVTSTQGMQDLFGLDGGKYGNTDHIAALDRHTVVDSINQIVSGGKAGGYVDYYRYKLFQEEDGSSTIIVLDCFLQLQSAYNMLRVTLLVYLIATFLFAISTATNFAGGNTVIGAVSLMGFTVLFKTYLKVKREYRESQRK